MSTYRDRTGQIMGQIEVIEDHKRTAAGKVVWRCLDHDSGRELYLRSERIIALDRRVPPTS